MNSIVQTNSLKAWLLAFRLKTLGAMLCPILIGSAFALKDKIFSWHYFFLTATCAILLQILANLVNDYGDFIKGADTAERLGPPRSMQMGWVTKNAMIISILLVLFACIILGLFLVFKAGPLVLLVGMFAIFFALWYTLGPLPLAYLGFSEVVVFLFFGPLAALGAYYIQTNDFLFFTFIASLTPAMLSTALIMTNNLRDLKEDAKNCKKTLSVRFGEKFSRFGIFLLLVLSMIPVIYLFFCLHNNLILLSLIPLIGLLKFRNFIFYEPLSKKFNLLLASIGKTLYLFGIIFSFGLVYG